MIDDSDKSDWWTEAKQRISPLARTSRDTTTTRRSPSVRQAIGRFVGCSPEERASLAAGSRSAARDGREARGG